MSNSKFQYWRPIVSAACLFPVVMAATASLEAGMAVRCLGADEMRRVVRGASPDCTNSLKIYNCDDQGTPLCSSLGESSCSGGCQACSSATAQIQYCWDTKPWTLLNCTAGSNPGGCGFYKISPQCIWSAPSCNCAGNWSSTTCDQNTINASTNCDTVYKGPS